MHPPLDQVTIFGPGLIGGSIALAARRSGLCARLCIWSRDATEREAVRRLEVADFVTDDIAAAAGGADLLLLCTPPAAMAALAGQIVAHLSAGAVVSDVASVKAGVAAELTAILGGRYAGAHPMAGAERQGLRAARPDLFEGAVCLLTPDPQTFPAALETVAAFWRGLGAQVRTLSPAAHDEAVALVSHLPHVLASTLVEFVAGEPGPALDCAGPGWRDMTRLAGGSPELWTEILSRNRGPVTYALRGMLDKLRGVIELLEAGRDAELQEFLARAKIRRGENLRKVG